MIFPLNETAAQRCELALTYKKIGDIINIETDCIGKYVEKLVPGHGSGVSREVLLRNGFI